jgi:hypothetical protein
VLGLTGEARQGAHARSDHGSDGDADQGAFDQISHGSISFHAANIEMRAQTSCKNRGGRRKESVNEGAGHVKIL